MTKIINDSFLKTLRREATPYTPGLSKWNVNGNYGIFYENRKWNFGLSLNNLFRTKNKNLVILTLSLNYIKQ